VPVFVLYRAAGIGGSGKLYVGCNLEFANLPLYNAVHAEQFLLVNALHNNETSIKKIAISAAPCGHCRQFFSELACAVSVGEKLPLFLRAVLIDLHLCRTLSNFCFPVEHTHSASCCQ
jgi:hypothetical protein